MLHLEKVISAHKLLAQVPAPPLRQSQSSHLSLELAHDQTGPPLKNGLGHIRVCVEMVTDVHHLLSSESEASFDHTSIAATIDSADFQFLHGRGGRQAPLLVDDLPSWRIKTPKVRLLRISDDEVEEVLPRQSVNRS
eukprot:CAMPEP_0115131662 /NCGR_PEP_ID=MMETSP0227-20121206/53260_1 /TAXON_ID=89957 /ORGANISM="Polarella glacialis, Strain CCMP 1383" /LENGTH=136 /DNA_ID=CAMNT_0002537245 /DNA_START=39 /DNA_END=449 /DNA_ORIENTATION=+